jgi:hypothetical protein
MKLASEGAAGQRVVRSGVLEGVCWGLAAWIKPFVVFVAGACWLTSRALVSNRRRRMRLFPLVVGVAMVVSAGVAWLVTSGTWPHFLDTMVNWNAEYGGGHAYHWHSRREVAAAALYGSLPWTLIHLVTIPLALLAVKDRSNGDDQMRTAALVGAFYLSWIVQTLLLQPRVHRYTLDSAVLLAIPLVPALAPREWKSSPIARAILAEFVLWCVLVHPLARGIRLAWWPAAIGSGSTAMRDGLSLHPFGQNGRIAWVDLDNVAAFMRAAQVRDGELLCFNDSTHRLYLELGIKPPLRYLQWGVIGQVSRRHDQVAEELASARVRFIVSDLSAIGVRPTADLDDLPDEWSGRFPWTYPAAFRAGPYVVHAVDGPLYEAWSW